MSVVINYKNNSLKPKFGNLIFFVNEKFSLSILKRYLTKSENETIADLLKSHNLQKKIISIELNSKKKFFLISVKSNINSSHIENLGAEFFDYLKDVKQREFFINSSVLPYKLKNFIGYFLHD